MQSLAVAGALFNRQLNEGRGRSPEHVPGSHTLYVGPAACSRRHVLATSEAAGGSRGRASYLDVDDVDLALGRTEDLLVEAVAELNAALPERPRYWFVWLRCMHEIAGVDDAALLDRLHRTYSDQRFQITHMNPVSMEYDRIPAPRLQLARYAFVEEGQPRDRGVTLVGVPPRMLGAELRELLERLGLGPLRAIGACATPDDYQALGRSAAVISLGDMGAFAAQSFAARVGIPWVDLGPWYDPDLLAARLAELAALAGAFAAALPDFSAQAARAREALVRAAAALDGAPLVLDTRTPRAFHLADVLLSLGANITHVLCRQRAELARPRTAEVCARWPRLRTPLCCGLYAGLPVEGVDPGACAVGEGLARELGLARAVALNGEMPAGFAGLGALARLFERPVDVAAATVGKECRA